MKEIFSSKSIKTLYRREKTLKEILSPSLFPAKPKNSEICITSCKKCDIYKNYLITDNKFKCKVTGWFYNVRGNLCCNNKCSDVQNPQRFLQVQLIESVVSDLDLENKLWEREKYWQCQLFTNTHGMNSVSDLYASKRKGCRKK